MDGPSDAEPLGEPSGTGETSPHARWTRRYRLARQLMQGDGDGPADFSAAFELLTEEANAGNALAMADLGRMYAEGVGTEQNYEKAARWLEKAAEFGNSFAKYQLGKLLLTRVDAVPKNVDWALKLLTECAEQGNQYAQYTLGKEYLLGGDVPQDQGQAVRWLGLSAQQGNQYAQYYMNRVYNSIFSSTASLLYHMGSIFQEQRPQLMAGICAAVDSKLRRKIREKKIAMGHKPDDHEDEQRMS